MNRPRAVVAGHGEFAAGMVSAVVQITGRDDVFLAISNRGLSAQDVERRMREVTAGVSVIFTDLPAGSCTMAARRLQREQPQLQVVTGVNLAALLDFVFSEAGDAATAAAAAAEKGRRALTVAAGGPLGGGGARGT
ncbi:MAG: PTS sugar transporter subunit IIA [Gemmatimonadota bacterium]